MLGIQGSSVWSSIDVTGLEIKFPPGSPIASLKARSGHDVNFCSDLPRRASEIQFSLALLQLSLALEKLYIIIL